VDLVAEVTPTISATFRFRADAARFVALVIAFACVSLASLGSAAFAEIDHWTGCRGEDVDARLEDCSQILARGNREPKRNRITAYVNRSGAYRAKGDFDRAIKDLDTALHLDPRSSDALIERASIYYVKGDLDRAIADYDAALKYDKDSVKAYAGRARAYLAKGDFDRALVDFSAASTRDPKSASLHFQRGSIYQRAGDLDRAIADYDAAIANDPGLPGVHRNRGSALSAKGDFDQALVDFGTALERDPRSAEVYVSRAEAYRGKRDLEHAAQDLEAALHLDPQLAAARDALDEVNRLVATRAAPASVMAPTAPAAPLPKQEVSDRVPQDSPLVSKSLFHVGPVSITTPVVATWVIMLVLSMTSWLVTRRLQLRPGRRQAALEIVVTGIMQQIEDIIGKDPRPFLPLLGTLFIFLVSANLSGLLPGGEAPTSKLETPAALALIVFVSVHFFGVRARGFRGYLASFAEPKLIMLPLNIVSEVTRTFSLMVRLFGNVMSGEFVIALVVGLAGLFVPIPLMVLEILVGIVQAYIFTVLATVFIGAAIGGVERG
jgi:F-type H+-transporting ATPase subunit a